MSDENITDSDTGNVADELPKSGDVPPPATTEIEGSNTPDLLQDQAEIPSPISSPSLAGEVERKEQRRIHRFRVGWHADIIFDDQSTHQGFINDISILGASLFLDSSSIPKQSTLYIHVPPLDLKSESHIIVVSGRTVYVVYDGDRQLYRAAFLFLKFHQKSDLAYLGERLSKYQSEIHEMKPSQNIV